MPTLRGEVKPELDDDNPYVSFIPIARRERRHAIARRERSAESRH